MTTSLSGSERGGNAPADVDRVARDVNAALIDCHANRLKTLGTDGSGLFSHYEMLLGQQAILREFEVKVFKLMRNALPRYADYAVLRAGLAELAFLIGKSGHRVTAYEPDERRFAAVMAGFGHLSAADPGLRDRFRAVRAFVPDEVRDRPLLGVATDFSFNLPLEGDESFRRGLRQFDALLMCPRLFIRTRDSVAEQREAVDFLRFLGYTRIVDFPEEQMVYAVRPRDAGAAASVDDAAAPDAPDAPVGQAADPFGELVERLMAVVPPPSASSAGSTWIDRRVRKFDLRSTLGGGE